GGDLILSQTEIRLRQKVQHDVRIVRIQTHRYCEWLSRPRWLPRIHQRQASRGMTLSKVGIKGNHAGKFRERAFVIASPQQHVAERHMAYRLLIVQFERRACPSL